MTVFARAIVMLVTLVGLPAAWIYYGPLPAGPQKVVDRFVEVARNALGWKQDPACETADPQGVAPRFGSPAPLEQSPEFLDAAVTPTALPVFMDKTTNQRVIENTNSQVGVSPAPVTLASAQMSSPEDTLLESIESSSSDDLAEELRPHFTLLQSLGAADYKLEKWGSAGRQYRFCCSIAFGDNVALARNFQAIDVDPLAAVRQVVGEVTAWQNARLAPTESVTRLR